MKRSKDLCAEREKFSREMEDARAERELEVAFHAAHPQYSPEEGQALATQFVAAILVMSRRIEADYLGKLKPDEPLLDHRPHWEIKSYLTAEQQATLDAAYARIEQLELKQKAKSYDDLLETLNDCGLTPDATLGPNNKWQDIITVENLMVATTWWREASANAYEDGED